MLGNIFENMLGKYFDLFKSGVVAGPLRSADPGPVLAQPQLHPGVRRTGAAQPEVVARVEIDRDHAAGRGRARRQPPHGQPLAAHQHLATPSVAQLAPLDTEIGR